MQMAAPRASFAYLQASLRTRLESWQAPADEGEGLAYAGASPALAARPPFADSDEAPWAPQAGERADVSGRREPQFDSEEDDSDEVPRITPAGVSGTG
mgnify:CR=1 FL=1